MEHGTYQKTVSEYLQNLELGSCWISHRVLQKHKFAITYLLRAGRLSNNISIQTINQYRNIDRDFQTEIMYSLDTLFTCVCKM